MWTVKNGQLVFVAPPAKLQRFALGVQREADVVSLFNRDDQPKGSE